MGGTITALRFQKRNKERVNVYIDGRFAFGLAAIEAARLHVGQTLSDEEIARLQERDEAEQGYERALNFLSYRPRSEAEVRWHLQSKNLDDEAVEAVIERLRQAGLLNDREFASYWVENRLQFNPRGALALRYELRAKGLSEPIIAEVLESLDEEALACQVAEAISEKLRHLPPRTFRRKLEAHLLRRGFSRHAIQSVIHEQLSKRNRSDIGLHYESSEEVE
ncbi:MAG: RecX family transcriptional regulator [Anaerolineae bacterium]|nr:RecX family transcriptional regulator [Anaerolineae bacterium]